MRSARMAATLLVTTLLVSACGSSGGSGVRAMSDAYKDLNGSVLRYSNAPVPAGAAPEQLFAVAAAQLESIRKDELNWAAAASKADLPQSARNGTPSRGTVDEFTSAMGQWLSVQDQMLIRLRACFGSEDPRACAGDLTPSNQPTWTAAVDRVNAAKKKLETEGGAR